MGAACRSTCYGGSAEQFGDDGYGDRICKCGTYEPAAGDIRYLWREYWDDHDSTADGI